MYSILSKILKAKKWKLPVCDFNDNLKCKKALQDMMKNIVSQEKKPAKREFWLIGRFKRYRQMHIWK